MLSLCVASLIRRWFDRRTFGQGIGIESSVREIWYTRVVIQRGDWLTGYWSITSATQMVQVTYNYVHTLYAEYLHCLP